MAPSASRACLGLTAAGPRRARATLIGLLAALALTGCAGTTPVERQDANSRAAHAGLLAKTRAGHIDVYFLGDSITRRWGTADPQYSRLLANWTLNFHGWNAADFGWGGDTTGNILWRIRHGELDGVNPRVIVLLAGTNDLGAALERHADPARSVGAVVDGIAALVRECRARAPRATVLLTSITPRSDHPQLAPVITRIDARLARLADGRAIRYLDIHARMSDAAGLPLPGMTGSDGLHLSVGGYEVWADALKPPLRELLGPPAAVDRAPPPSRNPGLPGR